MTNCNETACKILNKLIGDFIQNDNCFASDKVCATLCVRAFEAILQRATPSRICKLALTAREYLWEVLHSKSWVDISTQYRDAFGLFSFIVACMIPRQALNSLITSDTLRVHRLAVIDSGMLLGSEYYRLPLLQLVERIDEERIECLNLPERKCDDKSSISAEIQQYSHRRKSLPVLKRYRSFLSKSEDVSDRAGNIERVTAPHLLQFLQSHLLSSRPVVLTGCMEEWSALWKWKSLDYYAEGNAYGYCLLGTVSKKCCNLFRRQILRILFGYF